jgi:hypothetical protein
VCYNPLTVNTANIDELLDAAKDLCGEYGNAEGKPTQADLAREMEVSNKRVSEWLTRKTTPGGENALRLLLWVAARDTVFLDGYNRRAKAARKNLSRHREKSLTHNGPSRKG